MNAAKLFVIGDENAVFGFALLGVEGKIVHTADEAQQAFTAAMTRPELGILFLTETWASALRSTVDQWKADPLAPIVVEIPASQPTAARPSLRELVQQSLGLRLE
ncbi:MAG: V-type ATP synthase subunit F [Caldilineaceae bacterium]